MNPRQEIEFPWGDAVVRSRPTLARVAEVEAKHGAASGILRRIQLSELPLVTGLIPILMIVLRGCPGVPDKASEFADDCFDFGPSKLTMPLIEWLLAAYQVNETPAEGNDKAKPGN